MITPIKLQIIIPDIGKNYERNKSDDGYDFCSKNLWEIY